MRLKTFLQASLAALGVGIIAYGAYIVVAWARYGHPNAAFSDDALADKFMPAYEVREVHRINVAAPSDVTMEAANSVRFEDSRIIAAIFKAREVLLRATPATAESPKSFVAMVKSIGWRELANVPGREVVFGAVTQPWKANVVFEGLSPSDFVAFRRPDYVKILWTLRADPAGDNACVFRTETRVVSTDSQARAKFRRYWAQFSPGILLIRLAALPLIKTAAEQRAATLRVRR